MRVLIMNAVNIVPNSNNSKFQYQFPQMVTFNKTDQIAVSSINIFYSWFNVNASLYNNNSFQYVWFDMNGVLNTTYTITIQDGNYTIETLNEYMQSILVSRGHYLIQTSSGKYVYHIEFVANPTFYSAQLNIYYMMSLASSTGYTRGLNTWQLPTANTCPQVIINSTNTFRNLIGFKAGTYPSTVASTFQTFLSTSTPQLAPVSSIVMTCSLCQQSIATPDNLLYCFSSSGVAFGDSINVQPSALSFVNCREGTFKSVEIQLLDQNLSTIQIKDTQCIIMLTLRSVEEDGKYGL